MPERLNKRLTVRLLRSMITLIAGSLGLVSLVAFGMGGWYVAHLMRRPERVSQERSLFQGVTYERHIHNHPRPIVYHVVAVELSTPGIEFLVTPPAVVESRSNARFIEAGGADSVDTLTIPADTVPGFLRQQGVQVAINGSYFFPHYVKSPWHYYPKAGEPVEPQGISISKGDRYSVPEEGWAALCILSIDDIRITEGECPAGTQHGLAGDNQFVKAGQPYSPGLVILKENPVRLMPRSAIALDKDGQRLWLIVADGRQRGYSEGVTLAELSDFVIGLGADSALNFDGGGSSALAIEEDGEPVVLNSPIQARIPTRLRPVANHLGLYAQPLDF